MSQKPKFAIVVEGGGTRGIYAAGALDVLGENGIKPDAVIGVSAGAIHGCSFVSGQHGRSIRYYRKYLPDKRFFGIGELLRTGNIVGNDFCYHEIPEKLDVYDFEAFKKSGIDFYAVCSNLATGAPEYYRLNDMKDEIDILLASGSMPFCSTIVRWDGKELLDGGCTDSIPVMKAIEMGYEKIILIQTREEGYTKKPLSPTLAKLFYRKYPRFRDALISRHEMYNSTLEKIKALKADGKIIVVQPSEALTMGRLSRDMEDLEKTYGLGRKDCEALLEKIAQYLA